MAWDVGQARYRGRADRQNFDVCRNEKTGSKSVEGFIECTAGPQAGQRIRYRGYITGAGGVPSEENATRTANELRAMGASLRNGWKDLAGIGTKEVEFSVRADHNGERTYYRAAFVRAPSGLNRDRVVSDVELDDVPPPPPPEAPSANGARAAVPGPADPWDEDAAQSNV
jgi:hypothetical protein